MDVRIVAATNRDLAQRVKDGLFREDLFYRLNVVTVEVPPLRACMSDIPRLYPFAVPRIATTSMRSATWRMPAQDLRRRWDGEETARSRR